MHTHTYSMPGYNNVTVHANGDWSGPVLIQYFDADGTECEAELPGELLIALGQQIAIDVWRDKLIGILESAEFIPPVHTEESAAAE